MIVVEKILTHLAMPVGLVWIGLMMAVLIAWRRRQKVLFVWLLALLALFTSAGNTTLGTAMLRWLERDYSHIKPLESGRFDVVVVLGGGTNTNTADQPQLDQAGDRVILAAQLYHAGHAKQIAVTGKQIASISADDVDPADEAAELLRRLDVPTDCILRLSGHNTSEEMATLGQQLADHPDWQRVGLVTSAWHMPRALKLACRNGLHLEPLPADFRGAPRPWTILSIIPCAEGISRTQIAAKEMLAVLVGR